MRKCICNKNCFSGEDYSETCACSCHNPKKKKLKRPELKDFHLVEHTTGIIIDGIWVKDDGTEIIIRSGFFGDKFLHFKPLKENEKSL